MKRNLNDISIGISGSCSVTTDLQIINFSHSVIRRITKELLRKGVKIVTNVGKNPKVDETNKDSPSIIYDWDVIDEIYNYAKDLSFSDETKNSAKIIATTKSLKKIPTNKISMWEDLVSKGVVSVITIPFGWNSGAVRRQKMESFSDALLAVGGGEGVEHLAGLFSLNGKPILPLNISVGSSCEDGKGGAIYLAKEFISKPKKFIPKISDEMISKYTLLDYEKWIDRPDEYAKRIVDFLITVVVPQVFFVRLLNEKIEESKIVNQFFENVVIPFTKELNLSFKDMEISETEEGFLNVEIIKQIHKSKIVIVDLTGLRSNCFFYMVYAFGLNKKVIVTAKKETKLPFDTSSIPCFFWGVDKAPDKLKEEFQDFWIKNINRGPLISINRIV